MVRAVDFGGNESTTLSDVKVIRSPDALAVITESTWTGTWTGTKTDCAIEGSPPYNLVADPDNSGVFWSGGDTATFWATDATVDFWGVSTFKAMSYYQMHQMNYNDSDLFNWPTNDDLPCRERISELEIEGDDYRIEYRAQQNFINGSFSYYTDWLPWPGERVLQEAEFPFLLNALPAEKVEIRITISGGTTQGKLKKAVVVTEALDKVHRETVSVATAGTAVDLTGLSWRKITNVTVTPNNATSQGAKVGEVYALTAKHQPGGSGTAYELTGPTVKLYDSAGIATTGSAAVLIEGY
jgi:hypothetical protein